VFRGSSGEAGAGVAENGALLAPIVVAACAVGAATALDRAVITGRCARCGCIGRVVLGGGRRVGPAFRRNDRARGGGCGLWRARRRLVAAVLGPSGEARRVIRAALTDEARFGLVEYLAAAGAELVATDALTRVDLMPVQAARRGLAVWTASDALVAALLRAAAIRDPARAAALLARLPVIPLLRSSIRRLVPPDRRQLPLL
jgi:hypothetical protein